MRCAVVLALEDPRSSGAGMWIDAAAWLPQELVEMGFRVAVIDGEEVERDLAQALLGLTSQDEVFLHISGRLVDRGVICTAGGRWVRLQAIGRTLAALAGANVSLLAEVVHEDGFPDTRVAAEYVASIIEEIGARARGYAMVAAVRAASDSVEGLALTRLFVEAARAMRQNGALISSALYEQIAASPASLTRAQHFTFVAGDAEAPLPSFAAEPLSSFESEPRPSAESRALPSFESEPLPSFDLPAFTPQELHEKRALDDQIAHAADAGHARLGVALRRQRLVTIESDRLRVRELVAIARILQADLDDATGALEALEEARFIDPNRVAVLQALRRGYERLGLWENAFEVIGALADLSASPNDRAELRVAQAKLAHEQQNDQERALLLLQMALQNDPKHERALLAFDELCALRAGVADATGKVASKGPAAVAEGSGVEPEAPSNRTDARPSGDLPADPSFYAAAFAAHQREGRTDAAFLAASALEELGAASAHHQIVVHQSRSVAPIRARSRLDPSAWDLLRPGGASDGLAALFGAVARAAVVSRLEQLVEHQRLFVLDAVERLDENSTASVVRSFQWAARVLGVPCPALYVVEDVPGEIAAVRAPLPSTALAPSVLRGRSVKELAFLAGRHLTYYRPTHQVLVYFPTKEDLEALLTATIELDDAGNSPTAGAGAELRRRLERNVTKAEHDAIAAARRNLRGGVDLGAWARSVELSAGRAGLLLCGDLATATAVVRSESRPIAGLTPVDRRNDLIAFVASREHTELRARYVVTGADPPKAPPVAVRATTELAEPRSA